MRHRTFSGALVLLALTLNLALRWTQPAETQPAETQPAETQPAETQPAETQPAETQPAETQPAETQPAETQPAETQPAETQPAETQPAETQPAETQPAETQPAETQPAETQPSGAAAVQKALADLNAWMGDDSNAQAWRAYLRTEELNGLLEQGDSADPAAVERVLAQFQSSAAGLEKARFVAVKTALTRWLRQLQSPTGDLRAAAREAQSSFRTITAQDVERERQETLAAAQTLHHWLLTSGSANAAAWESSVEFDAMQQELSKTEGAKPEELERIAQLYRTDESGLEARPFIAMRRALRDYAQLLRLQSAPNLEETYTSRLKDLGDRLESLAKDPKIDDLSAVGHSVGWLDRLGQAPRVVEAARSRFDQPNVYATASERIIEAAFDDPEAKAKLNQPQGLVDNILGTALYGTVYPQLQMSVSLLPSDEHALINVRLDGYATSRNTGYRGPVTVQTNGYSRIAASKYIYFDVDGASASRTGASVATSSTILDICANCGLIEKIAWKQAGKQKGEAEAVASSHAQARIAGQVDSEMGARLADANRNYLEKFYYRLVRRDSFPELFKVSSTHDAVHVRMRHATSDQLATESEPPQLVGKHDLALQLHESGVVNFGETLLGGETLTDERLVEMLKESNAEVPEELQITEDKDPWSITFSSEMPISAQFRGDEVTFAIRGRRFTRGEQVVRADISISAAYQLEQAGGGSKLTRKGDVVVDYVNRDRLGVAQVAMKTFLRKKFDALFKPEITSDGLKLPARFQNIGKLQLRQLDADQGWLTLGWEQPAAAATAATGVVPAAHVAAAE